MKWAGVILVIVICGVLLFNQPISAQQGIFQIQGYELPADNDLSLGVALGDMDSDGDNDIVLANRAGQNRLYINDGSGTFTDISLNNLPEDNDLTWGVTLGDVDGDADIDIIFINDGQNRLYLNDGSGNFTDASLTNLPEDNDASRSVFLADTDGDGDADIVIANDGQNRLYLNNASGVFTDVTEAKLPADDSDSRGVALGDMNGDGDSDIIFANRQGQNRLYINDGSGAFKDTSSTSFPTVKELTWGVTIGDVDNDTDADIIFANDGQNRLYLNNGTGKFTDATATNLPQDNNLTWGSSIGDVDGDGDADIILATDSYNRLYLNNGAGKFTDATSTNLPGESDLSWEVALGDIDGDADLDIIFANNGQNRLHLNSGQGVFSDATSTNLPPDNNWGWGIVTGDMDGDGDADIILANDGQNRLYLNNGSGVFKDITLTNLPAYDDVSWHVAVGDVDDDDDLDIIFANNGQNRLYLNDSRGVFIDVTSTNLPPDSDDSRSVVLGDVDGDGDLDIAFATRLARNRLYLNDGSGVFTDVTDTNFPGDGDNSRGMALGDVDGDDDLDIIFNNKDGQNRLYLNDGFGIFSNVTFTNFPEDVDNSRGAAFGDIDGDGDSDLVIANRRGRNRIYANDGSGVFTDATALSLPTHEDWSLDVALGDVNCDGYLDIVFATYDGQNRLYLNDGSGVFADATLSNLPEDTDLSFGIALEDMDGDGDPDIVLANGGQDRLYTNIGKCPMTIGCGFPK